MSFCDPLFVENSAGSLLTLSIPFAKKLQRVNSPRYFWDNNLRRDGQFVILQRTLSGQGIFHWEGSDHEVPAGHAFLAIIPEPSCYLFPVGAGEPWTFSWLNLYGPLAIMLCRELRRLHGPVLPLPLRSPAGTALEAILARFEKRALTDPYDASIAGCTFLMEWARQLSQPQMRESDPIETAVKICRTRFRESLGIKELAAETGLSREHLTRLFMRRHGIAPATYLRSLRTDAAREMLDDGLFTLGEVALRCGFPSVRALNRALSAAKPAPNLSPDTSRPKARAGQRPASRETRQKIPRSYSSDRQSRQ